MFIPQATAISSCQVETGNNIGALSKDLEVVEDSVEGEGDEDEDEQNVAVVQEDKEIVTKDEQKEPQREDKTRNGALESEIEFDKRVADAKKLLQDSGIGTNSTNSSNFINTVSQSVIMPAIYREDNPKKKPKKVKKNATPISSDKDKQFSKTSSNHLQNHQSKVLKSTQNSINSLLTHYSAH